MRNIFVRLATWILFLGFATLLSAQQTLAIAAAANLKTALDALAPVFESRHPGCKLQVSLGASGSLTTQIQQGAPFDVFLAADTEFPEKLRTAGLVSGACFPYATGRLVLWIRKDLGLDPTQFGLQVLTHPAVKRIAIANPAIAPFGRSAEQALRKMGLYALLQTRFVIGENITQAAQYLQTGAAEAGFISSPQALAAALNQGVIWTIPQELYPVQKQSGAILKRASQPALAQAFRDFLLSTEAQALFIKWGYAIP